MSQRFLKNIWKDFHFHFISLHENIGESNFQSKDVIPRVTRTYKFGPWFINMHWGYRFFLLGGGGWQWGENVFFIGIMDSTIKMLSSQSP